MGKQRLVRLPGWPLAMRIAGWLGADGNPLRRRTDRVEGAIRLLLLLAFLACGPLLASATGTMTQSAGLRQIRQQQSWRQVPAVLLRPAPQPYYAYSSMTTYRAPGRWLAPTGVVKVGQVPTPAGLPAGAIVRIWVDASGRLTGRAPLKTRVVVIRTVLAELVTMTGLAIALLVLAGLVRWVLNRRRMASWAIEWASFGPRWSTRH